jgi:hypothetical protein
LSDRNEVLRIKRFLKKLPESIRVGRLPRDDLVLTPLKGRIERQKGEEKLGADRIVRILARR